LEVLAEVLSERLGVLAIDQHVSDGRAREPQGRQQQRGRGEREPEKEGLELWHALALMSDRGGGRLDQRVGAVREGEAKASRESQEGEERSRVRGSIERGEHGRSSEREPSVQLKRDALSKTEKEGGLLLCLEGCGGFKELEESDQIRAREHERSEANREKASPHGRGRPGAQERAERESFSAASQEAAAARAKEAAAAEANRAKGAAKGAASWAEGARAMRFP
jgi:hypothetical protein